MTRDSFSGRLLAPIVELRTGETTTALLMFTYSFLAMTAYNIVKPITRSKFIDDLGADNLPYVLLGAGLFVGVVMQLYSRLVGLLPRRWVIPCTGCGMTVLLIAFWFLFRTDSPLVSVGLYLYGLIIGILLISQFWTLANDIYDPRQAKRLFGFIGGGASLGGMTGAGLTALLVDTVGTENLLLGSATVLAACMLVVSTIVRREHLSACPTGAVPGQEDRLTGKQAIRLLRDSRHLQIIALVIGFAVAGAAIIEQQLNMAAEAFKGREGTDALTGFLAQITFYLSAVGFIIQIGLTSRVHRLLGIGFALLVLPASLGTTAVVMLFSAALWAPAFARILDSSLRYTLDKTTREVLFLPLPAALKYQAKPFVDVTVDRFAKGIAAVLLLVLIKGAGVTWQQLSYASVVITAIWVATAVRARREYLAAFRRSLERQDIEAATVRLPVADLSTLETLVQELAHPDERRVIYAIDLLEALEKGHLVTPFLLRHASAKVRARALGALESARPEIGEHWLASVEPMLRDDSLDVRVAAVRALAAIRGARAAEVMRPYLRNNDPRVSVTAAMALVDSEHRPDRENATSVLTRLAAESSDAPARREVAAALGTIGDAALRHLLVPLMYDAEVEVAEEAIRSVERRGARDPLFLPVLMSLLGHRLLKRSARQVLVSYGEDALDTLAHVLRDPEAHMWVRRHIPATLARIPGQKSMDILTGALTVRDGFLRYKVVAALEKLRQEHPELTVAREPVEDLALTEAQRYFRHLNLYALYAASCASQRVAEDTLLARALNEKLRRTLDRTYRLLGLIYPQKDVRDAWWAIEHGSARLRAGAIEYLDNLLSGALRKRLMPVFEDVPLEDKARKGQALLARAARTPEESLAELMTDEDPIVAAAARHLAAERGTGVNGTPLAASSGPARQGPRASGEPLLTVDVVARLRRIPLFDFISVDELFRIADAGRQVHHAIGEVLYREGQAHDVLEFLLEGTVRLERTHGDASEIAAPAALGFEEVVEPCPMTHTAQTAGPVVCLALTSDEFFAVLAENPELTQGLFRMLLDNPILSGWRPVVKSATANHIARLSTGAPTPVDDVLLLQEIPLFTRANVKQLIEVTKITRRVPFGAGAPAFSEGDVSAICMPLSGRLTLCHPEGGEPAFASPGDIFGIYETLVGIPAGCRGEVVEPGVALRIDREDLFDLLADHIDLLRGLFSVMCTRPLPRLQPVRG